MGLINSDALKRQLVGNGGEQQNSKHLPQSSEEERSEGRLFQCGLLTEHLIWRPDPGDGISVTCASRGPETHTRLRCGYLGELKLDLTIPSRQVPVRDGLHSIPHYSRQPRGINVWGTWERASVCRYPADEPTM